MVDRPSGYVLRLDGAAEGLIEAGVSAEAVALYFAVLTAPAALLDRCGCCLVPLTSLALPYGLDHEKALEELVGVGWAVRDQHVIGLPHFCHWNPVYSKSELMSIRGYPLGSWVVDLLCWLRWKSLSAKLKAVESPVALRAMQWTGNRVGPWLRPPSRLCSDINLSGAGKVPSHRADPEEIRRALGTAQDRAHQGAGQGGEGTHSGHRHHGAKEGAGDGGPDAQSVAPQGVTAVGAEAGQKRLSLGYSSNVKKKKKKKDVTKLADALALLIKAGDLDEEHWSEAVTGAGFTWTARAAEWIKTAGTIRESPLPVVVRSALWNWIVKADGANPAQSTLRSVWLKFGHVDEQLQKNGPEEVEAMIRAATRGGPKGPWLKLDYGSKSARQAPPSRIWQDVDHSRAAREGAL
jgi:hypothetical protein